MMSRTAFFGDKLFKVFNDKRNLCAYEENSIQAITAVKWSS